MVGQRLKVYIQSCGLEGDDVPKVLGAFLAAKYSTWFAALYVGIRCQPLRRLFLARSKALAAVGESPLRHLGQSRPRDWAIEAWERSRRHHPSSSRRANGHNTHSAGHDGPPGKRLKESRPVLPAKIGEAFDVAKNRYHHAEAKYRDAKGRWHTASRELLRMRLQQCHILQRRGQESWYAWVSARYWQLSDKLEAVANSNRVWRAVSSNLHIDPRGLALGFAEGTIMYKFTFLIHAPLELWLITQFFKRQRQLAASTADSPQYHSSWERYLKKAQTVFEAARDADRLSREMLADYREEVFGIQLLSGSVSLAT